MTPDGSPDAVSDAVPLAVATALRRFADGGGSAHGVVLAVSGGRDSMALLHAAVVGARRAVRMVAVFDHGTGTRATDAAALVRTTADALGVPVIDGTATRAGHTEAEWRDARWQFLRDAAAAVDASAIATAHTADDQIETVVMRVLRGAGARGLAALAAPSAAIVRPLLGISRARVAAYAERAGVRWIDDPSNTDRRHLRVRFRADLLPALERVQPGTSARVVDVAARAAQWRDEADAWAAGCADDTEPARADASRADGGRSRDTRVPVSALAECGPEALAVFWPALAARAGVRLDRRAIARLVAYTGHILGRMRDGTVQLAQVPVAGGRVALVHAADSTGTDVRAWRFIIAAGAGRGIPRTGDWRGGAWVV